MQTYADEWCGVGLVGLPVPGEEQFKVDRERGLAAAYSGHIYDFQKLPAEQLKPTRNKATRLMELYASDAESLPEKLSGSFNAAVFDLRARRAAICNDRLGHWHLYYYEDDRLFLFAGEFKAFRAYANFDREIDDAAVRDFFNYQLVLGDRTFFKRVKRLRWAHRIAFADGRVSIKPWWEWRLGNDSTQPVSELVEESHHLYQDIVRKQTAGASHVIIPLSGGLDSRMVLAHARLAGIEPHTFSHGQSRSLEVKLAARVAATAGVKHHRFIDINPAWTADYAERFIWLTGGMVEIGPSILLGVADQYGLPATTSVFLNGVAGRTAFAYGYFNAGDIRTDVSRDEKLRRLCTSLAGSPEDENSYSIFSSEFRRSLKASYYPAVDSELSVHERVSDLFCHQRDLFVLHNRFKMMFDQVDVNRYVLQDHWALEDDRTLDFYLKVPPALKAYPVRTLLVEALKSKFPELARIPQQHGNVNLFETPSALSSRAHRYKKRLSYLMERGSHGLLNFRDLDTYVHYNQWYRTNHRLTRVCRRHSV